MMPTMPGTFRPGHAPKPGQRKREADRRRDLSSKDVRVRGRKGVAMRRRRLAREPCCRHCAERGIVTLATVVDHIVPLAFGGTDTDDNVQSLCRDCDAVKTAMDSASQGGAATHPEWLNPSAVPLTIVCGPPCAGKSTYVREHAGPRDVVIDVDSIASSIDADYEHWQGKLKGALWRKTIRVRNAMLGSLERQVRGRAWFIVAAPTAGEREWWRMKLGGEVVLLHPGVEECKRRAVARGTPAAVRGVLEWERKSRDQWRRRT